MTDDLESVLNGAMHGAKANLWPLNNCKHGAGGSADNDTNPVLIDCENMMLAGHGRVAAARLLGLPDVPCIRIETMTPEEKRAYVIADNKLALNAGWDEDVLAGELKALLSADIAFDVGVTGFSITEIDSIIDGASFEEVGNPEEDWLPEDAPAVCEPGDIWHSAPIV